MRAATCEVRVLQAVLPPQKCHLGRRQGVAGSMNTLATSRRSYDHRLRATINEAGTLLFGPTWSSRGRRWRTGWRAARGSSHAQGRHSRVGVLWREQRTLATVPILNRVLHNAHRLVIKGPPPQGDRHRQLTYHQRRFAPFTMIRSRHSRWPKWASGRRSPLPN